MNAVVGEFVAEGADADAEELGGVGAVLAGLLQGAHDVAFFEFNERQYSVGLGCRSRGSGGGCRSSLAGGGSG